ncbi:MAG: spondin domain-containing protein [Phycisphaerales bacterium]
MRFMTTAALAAAAIAPSSFAGLAQVRITVENLAPTNSVSFAPLRFGFHDGTFDVFNNGEVATAPIISVAEGGSGADWFPAFNAQQPNGDSGSVVPNPAGPLLPGQTATVDITVDSSINRFFTFASMVVPSNDYFIGNDSGTQYEIFDTNGNLMPTVITQRGRDIWDAGSEVDGAFGAAFLQGSSNDDRIAENGVVEFDFADLSVFNGLTTAAGYTFDSQLTADGAVYRITITEVPAPGAAAALGLAGLAVARRRRVR